LPTTAAKAPDGTMAESGSKRFSRCTHNETARAKAYSRSVPFIELLVPGLAQTRPLVFLMDGSELGRGYCSAREVRRMRITKREKRYGCY
jgi:hypothetical protein